MVEAMYENTKARVVVGSGMSNEFQVNIGLRQGSALRGRSQLSTFMKAYTAYARGRGSGTTVRFSPENQHLFLITDNVL